MITVVNLLFLWLVANVVSGLLAWFCLAPFKGLPGLTEHALFLIKLFLGAGLFYYILLTGGKASLSGIFLGFMKRFPEKVFKAFKNFLLYLGCLAGAVAAVLLALYIYSKIFAIPADSLTAALPSNADLKRFSDLGTAAFGGRWLYLLGAWLLAPVIEELYYRGLLYPELRKSWGFPAATVVTAIVFGLLHPNIAVAVLDGAFLCYTYEKGKDLQVNILTHSFLNIFFVAAMFAVYHW
ncbi:MAG: CPBP family intramembrane metalloprotease [Elusimicrobia bacterium]|nr:CPBP family intramembrane metalloprotease [Elusimicrobiota bacterium]